LQRFALVYYARTVADTIRKRESRQKKSTGESDEISKASTIDKPKPANRGLNGRFSGKNIAIRISPTAKPILPMMVASPLRRNNVTVFRSGLSP
jgi:hypothetical protein